MDSAVINAMRTELAALDAKAEALRAVISLYVGAASKQGHVRLGDVARVTVPRSDKPTNALAVLNTARDLCMRAYGPVPTKDILDAVERNGVTISGTVPQNVVSSILSRSDEFYSNGRHGWTLTENGPPEGGPDAEEVDASSSEGSEFDL